MATKCPGCSTTYNVTPRQLQTYMVRSRKCTTVFDGFKTRTTLPDELPFEARPQSAASGRIKPAGAGWAFSIRLFSIGLSPQVVYAYYSPDSEAMMIIEMA